MNDWPLLTILTFVLVLVTAIPLAVLVINGTITAEWFVGTMAGLTALIGGGTAVGRGLAAAGRSKANSSSGGEDY